MVLGWLLGNKEEDNTYLNPTDYFSYLDFGRLKSKPTAHSNKALRERYNIDTKDHDYGKPISCEDMYNILVDLAGCQSDNLKRLEDEIKNDYTDEELRQFHNNMTLWTIEYDTTDENVIRIIESTYLGDCKKSEFKELLDEAISKVKAIYRNKKEAYNTLKYGNDQPNDIPGIQKYEDMIPA